MTMISGLASTTSALLANFSLATPGSSTPPNAADQSAGSSAGPATTAPAASTFSSTTPSADDVAAAKAGAANSASYSFATVGQNALTVINAGIQQLGHQPNNSTTGAQWQQVFGNMDRRSLYAVASNQGGQFTTQEQQVASSMMVGQEGNVLNAQGNVGAMSNESDQMNAFGNYITFLQNVSPEEKQSPQWAMDMASAQTSYNDFASDLGKPTQSDNGSTNPLVAVLMAAMKAAQHNPSGGMRLTLSRQIIKCPVQNRYCSIDGEWYVH